MHFGAEEFVLFGFVLFVALLIYLGAHKTIGGMLDARIDKVKQELAEAERLRKEAADVLDDYKRKAAEAEKDAAAIVEQARQEAEHLARETEQRMAEFVTRRTKQAEQKIAMAEAQAAADVRAAAADAAVRAAEQVMRQDVKGAAASDLLAKGIAEMKQRLN
ncbi:MAG: ATP F0F1 synthase subunit B [Methylobacteriaceae bacterium]|nr:ATP F0F1 synthase subunit B [Methylobacteriaceae bacterium]